jgi:hypothetical protein
MYWVHIMLQNGYCRIGSRYLTTTTRVAPRIVIKPITHCLPRCLGTSYGKSGLYREKYAIEKKQKQNHEVNVNVNDHFEKSAGQTVTENSGLDKYLKDVSKPRSECECE